MAAYACFILLQHKLNEEGYNLTKYIESHKYDKDTIVTKAMSKIAYSCFKNIKMDNIQLVSFNSKLAIYRP